MLQLETPISMVNFNLWPMCNDWSRVWGATLIESLAFPQKISGKFMGQLQVDGEQANCNPNASVSIGRENKLEGDLFSAVQMLRQITPNDGYTALKTYSFWSGYHEYCLLVKTDDRSLKIVTTGSLCPDKWTEPQIGSLACGSSTRPRFKMYTAVYSGGNDSPTGPKNGDATLGYIIGGSIAGLTIAGSVVYAIFRKKNQSSYSQVDDADKPTGDYNVLSSTSHL
jgi:hypothetical protein